MPRRSPEPAPAPVEAVTPASTRQYVVSGALQLLAFLGYSSLAALVTAGIFDWISAASGVLDAYLRSVAAGGALFVFLFTLPIVAKWLLIGRWKPRQFRVWSLSTSASGSSRRWSGATCWSCCSWARRCTRCTCGRWARRSAGGRDPLPERAGVHRPAHHRRRHRDPQGLVPQRLPGPRTA